MNLSQELLEEINLMWEDEGWVQVVDYEKLPFRCRKFHEYGNLSRDFPTLKCEVIPTQEWKEKEEEKDSDGFNQVQ